MPDRYAVFGHPIAHSKSPAIHARFAEQTGQALTYEAILAPLDGFSASIASFIAGGGRGANVTVPFKEEAFRLCARLTERARRAGAVNTLSFEGGEILGDNTDGAGLVTDIERNLAWPLAGCRLLLLGAGGAARGALGPLWGCRPASIVIANRSVEKARALAMGEGIAGPTEGCGFADLAGREFDVVINATSASLHAETLPLPAGVFAQSSLAYDMMYGKGDTPFLAQARAAGASRLADGLGMLVEQAAEAFERWRNVRPQTGAVLAELRASLAAQ